MGHSMGGKTALAFGLKYPEQVKSMIVVDMSPLGYNHLHDSSGAMQHERIINALLKMDIDQITSREDADLQLQPSIKSKAVRQFLLKNLKRTPDGKFRWALNLQALAGNLNRLFAGIPEENEMSPANIPEFPLLFIKGELSDYIGFRDEQAIHQYFPWAELVVIQGSGHWVHAEQPTSFLKTVRSFLLHP
jgi:pimeloyl-ACP methyl ester carboxylesterase